MIFTLIVAGAVIFVVFSLAMLPQIGVAYIIESGGGPVLVVAAAYYILGVLWHRRADDRLLLAMLGLILLYMALSRGFYWHVFDRGDGILTANRVLAVAVFVAAAAVPTLWSYRSVLSERRKGRPAARPTHEADPHEPTPAEFPIDPRSDALVRQAIRRFAEERARTDRK